MGCGGSKFDPENIAPAGLRPLRRRIEEIRRRRNAAEIKESTPSTKELLDDAANDADTSPADSIHNDCRKSVSLPAESVEAPKESALVQEEHVKAKVPESDVAVEKPCSKEKEEEVKKKEAEGKREEPALVESVEVEEEEEGEEEEEEEEGEKEEGRGLCKCEASDVGPGSPSFREYYVASVRNSVDSDSAENIKDEDKKSAGTKEKKSRRKDSNASANSSEGSLNKLTNKGKKGRRFRKVLPKGGQLAMV